MKEKFGLYLILTDPVSGYETCAKAAVSCDVRYLQLRMKEASCRTILATARSLRKITEGTNTRLIINDMLNVAIESDADGVHLGQTDMSLSEARSTWNRNGKMFGLSTHTPEQAQQALNEVPDYIGIGPVFPTPTKADTAPVLGVQAAGSIAGQTTLTSVAIGGIHSGNLSSVLSAGFDNFCVVSAVNAAADPSTAIRELQTIWKNHHFCT